MSADLCDVCETGRTVGVGCVPMVAMSVAYCQACLDANAHPWGILVGNTACIGSLDQANEEWREMVECTCRHLGKTMEEFNAAVNVAEEGMDAYFKALDAKEKTADDNFAGIE